MQFNNPTQKNGLIQRCEFWTNLGDNKINNDSYLLPVFTQGANNWYHKIVTMILESRDDVDFDDPNQTDQPKFTFPLVASQRDYNLALSEKILKIKRADVCWNGTGNTCYKARRLDSSEVSRGLGNDTDVDKYFTTEDPRYDLSNNGYTLELYPRATAAQVSNNGVIRLETVREIDEFNGTQLAYDAQSGNFTAGLTVTGGTSGATAVIASDDDNGTTGTLTVYNVQGTFVNDETITDTSTGSATVNVTVPDTTQEAGFDEPFHDMISIGTSYDWLLINRPDQGNLITRLEARLVDYEARLRRHYGMKVEDTPMPLVAANVNYE